MFEKRYISTLSLLLLMLMTTSGVFAQQPNDLISKGNTLYDAGKYGEAEMTYREGQAQGADAFISGFNLGDALFKQERFEEAANAFQSLPKLTDDKEQKAAAYHNLGNSYLKAQKFQESVDAYKQSLRNNPKDLETKYNLAYAKRMLQQEQEQQQQQQDQDQDQENKDDQEKQDQQQQQDQKQDENKDDEQKQDRQQQQDQKQDQEQQEQPKEGEISKEDAERMLDALNQDEKKIRDRLEDQKVKKGVRGNVEKDW